MKKSKFSEAEILAAIKRAEEGQSVTELCRELKITRAAFYKWRTKHGWVKQNAEPLGKAASRAGPLNEL